MIITSRKAREKKMQRAAITQHYYKGQTQAEIEAVKKPEPLLAKWIDRMLLWLAGLLLIANIINQLGKYRGWW